MGAKTCLIPLLAVVALLTGCRSLEDRFVEAIVRQDVPRVEAMLRRDPTLIHDRGSALYAALHSRGPRTAEILRGLLARGADPDEFDRVDEPLLTFAADPEVLAILAAEADQESKDLALAYHEVRGAMEWIGRSSRYADPDRWLYLGRQDLASDAYRQACIDVLRRHGAGSAPASPLGAEAHDAREPLGDATPLWGWATLIAWRADDRPALLFLCQTGAGLDAVVLDSDLRVVRVGHAPVSMPAKPRRLVEIRSSHERMPATLRGRWITAIEGEMDPRRLSYPPVAHPEPDARPDDRRRIFPLDWLGDDLNLREHYFRPEALPDLEVRAPAAEGID